MDEYFNAFVINAYFDTWYLCANHKSKKKYNTSKNENVSSNIHSYIFNTSLYCFSFVMKVLTVVLIAHRLSPYI